MQVSRGLICVALGGALFLAGCAAETSNEQPSFYQSLATSGATVDANAAASMIYRLPPQ